VIEPDQLPIVRAAMRERAEADRRLLDDLRAEVRPLGSSVRRIQPRSATAISLVASDGGNNKIQFDPFLMQVVRVVDSYGQQLHLDVVSPTTDTDTLSAAQFDGPGAPRTALGVMMDALGVRKLYELSPMIPRPSRGDTEVPNPSWIQVYRDLCEWAVLYDRIANARFATDTLLVRDGFLRSKVFARDLFILFRNRLRAAIENAERTQRRRIFLVGVAKHSKVLARYRLAMALENILTERYPCYLRVPRELEKKAYLWPEYAVGVGESGTSSEAPKFVAGVMYLVKFGRARTDPIWAIDILDDQASQDAVVFGHLLSDALDGFPVPLYPRCLQKAHENAALVDFDMDVLEQEVFDAVRCVLPIGKQDTLDTMRFYGDPANQRYE
jgi:hypothetical protein